MQEFSLALTRSFFKYTCIKEGYFYRNIHSRFQVLVQHLPYMIYFFVFFSLRCYVCWHKAIEHLVQPTYASPVAKEGTGAQNGGAPLNKSASFQKDFTVGYQVTARIVDVGSMKLQLHHLAYKIFSFCFQHNIDLHVQWIPRDLNSQADFVSEIRNCDDWQLTPQCFHTLEHMWGPRPLDCFASYYNAKTPRFFSHFWNLGTAGVDAFFQSWEGENCLVVPPVSIITRVLSYISLQNVAVTLVVPAWPSASFWPLLWQRYSSLIKQYCYFKGNYACCHGRARRSLTGSSNWNDYIIAGRLASDRFKS